MAADRDGYRLLEGAYFIDQAPIRGTELLLAVIARTLGLSESALLWPPLEAASLLPFDMSSTGWRLKLFLDELESWASA